MSPLNWRGDFHISREHPTAGPTYGKEVLQTSGFTLVWEGGS